MDSELTITQLCQRPHSRTPQPYQSSPVLHKQSFIFILLQNSECSWTVASTPDPRAHFHLAVGRRLPRLLAQYCRSNLQPSILSDIRVKILRIGQLTATRKLVYGTCQRPGPSCLAQLKRSDAFRDSKSRSHGCRLMWQPKLSSKYLRLILLKTVIAVTNGNPRASAWSTTSSATPNLLFGKISSTGYAGSEIQRKNLR